MTSGRVKSVDRSWSSSGEDGILDQGLDQMDRNETDTELRKHRDQKGLETPVVYAVNDVHSLSKSASEDFGE